MIFWCKISHFKLFEECFVFLRNICFNFLSRPSFVQVSPIRRSNPSYGIFYCPMMSNCVNATSEWNIPLIKPDLPWVSNSLRSIIAHQWLWFHCKLPNYVSSLFCKIWITCNLMIANPTKSEINAYKSIKALRFVRSIEVHMNSKMIAKNLYNNKIIVLVRKGGNGLNSTMLH